MSKINTRLDHKFRDAYFSTSKIIRKLCHALGGSEIFVVHNILIAHTKKIPFKKAKFINYVMKASEIFVSCVSLKINA